MTVDEFIKHVEKINNPDFLAVNGREMNYLERSHATTSKRSARSL